MSDYRFDYHYGTEANQYSFYRIPKALFTEEIFKGLSCEAKVLYGLMLDRMGLSIKNNWIDENNRVYIFFTLEDAKEALNCGQEKGVKLFAELDVSKGIGLIERKKQGMGRPSKIYVKHFVGRERNRAPNIETISNDDAVGSSDVKTSEKQKSLLSKNQFQDIGKADVNTSENRKSGDSIFRCNEVGEPNGNNTNYNDNEINEIENQSINQSGGFLRSSPHTADAYEVFRQILKDNIDYESVFQYDDRKKDVDEILELMLEAICSAKKYLSVNSERVPAELVKSRLLKLDFTHIEYVLECIDKNTTKVSNIRSYLLTALYNSFTSINHHYKTEVNHDLYGAK